MSQQLNQLKQIVEKGGYAAEDINQVYQLEEKLRELAAKEDLANHPVIKPYLDYLRGEIVRCKEKLSEDDKLTELDRIKLFEHKVECRRFLDIFSTAEKKLVEQTINELLDVAKTS